MIGALEADDSQSWMNDHSIVSFVSFSLAEECKRLCDDEVRINSVKSCTKSKKREGNKKFKKEVTSCKIRIKLSWQE